MSNKYEHELKLANVQLEFLLEGREEIEIEIAKKKQQIAALMTLAEQNEEIDQVVGMTLGGLTEACVAAFRAAFPEPLTPVQVKERLAQLGFPVKHYRNAMAAIHTVVGRLCTGGRIVPVTTLEGEETAYRLAVSSRFSSRVKSKFKR